MAIVADKARPNSKIDLHIQSLDPEEGVGYVAGRWYMPTSNRFISAGAASAANQIRLIPFFVSQTIRISELATRITGVAAAGLVQLAIYRSHRQTKYPTGPVVANTGSLSTTSLAIVSGAIVQGPVALTPGLYWMAINKDTAGAAATILTVTGGEPLFGGFIGSETVADINTSATSAGANLFLAQTFGTWPNMTGAALAIAQGVAAGMLFYKVSGVS